MKLSVKYLTALRDALDVVKYPSAAQRTSNLQDVMLMYGDFYPEFVMLGGKAYQMEASSGQGDWSGGSTTQSTNVGVSAGYGPASANVGVATGNDSSNNSSNTAASASQQYQTVGGNGLLNGNSNLWIQSVGEPDYWRVIQFGRFATH